VDVLLVEGRDRPLAQLPPAASASATRRLAKVGVELRVATRVELVESAAVTLRAADSAPERIRCDLFVWTAGICGTPCVREWGMPVDAKCRVSVPATLEVPTMPGVFVIGDAVLVLDGAGKPFPWNAQGAMRQGKVAAANALACLSGSAQRAALGFGPFPTVVTAGGMWAQGGRS
jgi:NADH dehydrogenase